MKRNVYSIYTCLRFLCRVGIVFRLGQYGMEWYRLDTIFFSPGRDDGNLVLSTHGTYFQTGLYFFVLDICTHICGHTLYVQRSMWTCLKWYPHTRIHNARTHTRENRRPRHDTGQGCVYFFFLPCRCCSGSYLSFHILSTLCTERARARHG